MARWFPITADAHRALTDSAAYAGPRVTLADRLGPDVWPKVKTVLEKLGAVYAVGTSAFDFEADQDAHAIVSAALAAGRVMGAANADGFVPTPAELAADLVSMHGELSPSQGRRLRVLEPSAGAGRFVAAIRDRLSAQWCEITAVEPDARRARQIPTDDATTVHVETFEVFAERARAAGYRPDVVIMNPPFSVPGRPTLWAEHLLTAWELLAPGGRLVAILPSSVLDTNRAGRVGQAAALVRQHGRAEALDRDTFAESGITYGTAAVWLDRPPVEMVTPVPPLLTGLPAFVARPYAGGEIAEPVSRPYLTRGAALTMPVQLWHDGWHGGPRTLRYWGECVTCERPAWGFDDGQNDPRGALGDSAAELLDPAEHDAEGLPVAACFLCMNDGRETYERAWRMAAAYWATVAASRAVGPVRVAPASVAEPEPADPFVSGWAQLAPAVSVVPAR